MSHIETDAKEIAEAYRQGGRSAASSLFQEKCKTLKHYEALALKEKFLSMLKGERRRHP